MAIKLIPPGGSGSGGGGGSVVDTSSTITLTYTGTPQSPMFFTERFKPAIAPAAAAVGSNEYTSDAGKAFEGIVYAEDGSLSGNYLQSIVYEDVKFLFSVNSFTNCAGLTSISFPVLQYAFSVNFSGGFEFNSLPLLDTLSFPNLDFPAQIVEFSLGSCPTITSLSLPSAVALDGFWPNFFISSTGLTELLLGSLRYAQVTISSCADLATFTLTSLVCADISIDGASMTSFSLPAFTGVGVKDSSSPSTPGTKVYLTNNASLTSVSVPALIHLPSTGNDSPVFKITGSPALTTVTFGAVGTTKSILDDVTITGAALSQASVDAILHVLSTLDGTSGTTTFTGTVDLSGGTSSAPSVTGATYVVLLTGQGATVVTN